MGFGLMVKSLVGGLQFTSGFLLLNPGCILNPSFPLMDTLGGSGEGSRGWAAATLRGGLGCVLGPWPLS